jgi:hypothetical protein
MEVNKCANSECRFCIKGEAEKMCLIGGEMEHRIGIDPNTGKPKKD